MTQRAERDLRRVGADHAERIHEALSSMEADPYQGDVRQVIGRHRGQWRRRVGEWRIRFALDVENRRVVVQRILPGHSAYGR